MDASPTPTPTDALASTIASINTLVAELGEDPVDPGKISLATGIPVDRVLALLDGKDDGREPLSERELFTERLNFLRKTRLRDDGKERRLEEIAEGTNLYRQKISNILKGEGVLTYEDTTQIAIYFGVDINFFNRGDRDALNEALQPYLSQLQLAAVARAVGISGIVLRGTGEGTSDTGALRDVVIAALSSKAPEKEADTEITRVVRSLTPQGGAALLPVARQLLEHEQRTASGKEGRRPSGKRHPE
ncbi:MAG: family transcriptional regulator [Streptosporangiaceae bacterium]|nr:family transcriptional regulator [Streptosporangiaceae bacterium]